jgi:hypothetical protein
MDVPVLANQHILGGWHNIVPGITGEFFENEDDISPAIQRIYQGGYRPKEWFEAHRGENSRRLLADFLSKIFRLEQRPSQVYIG